MIGDLYDADNVIVGQAATLIAPQGTPLPDFATLNQDDPFDPTPWQAQTLTITDTSAWTLVYNGVATTALTHTDTAAEIEDALNVVLQGIDLGYEATVTGEVAGPFVISLNEPAAQDGVLTSVATTSTAALTGGLWIPCGATDQGWKYGTNKSVQTTSIEEQSTPVSSAISSQAVTIEGSLSEDTTETLALAYNGLVTRTAATADEPGFEQVALTDTIIYYAVALLTNHVNGRPRIIYAPKWSQLSDVETSFRRAADKRMYPVSFATLCKPSQIVATNFVSDPTG